jgi:alkyldihydroxyacetonephosphate synthase
VIAEAWVRVRPRPAFKASVGVTFDEFAAAVEAVREIAQSGLHPSNCRLLDAEEAGFTGAGDGQSHLLLLGFESAHLSVEAPMAQALEIARTHGGTPGDLRSKNDGDGAVDTWRGAFLLAPYLRDTFVACGVLSETFETAITWDRFEDLHAGVTAAVEKALQSVCGGGWVTCRFTHVYPDGPAPYFSFLAGGRPGSQLSQWEEIKAAASDAVLAFGGTITHHHAVGRDHRRWYDQQRPDGFAQALAGAKSALDPAGILNPGVLIG